MTDELKRAIENHRKMWKFIKSYQNNDIPSGRWLLKAIYLRNTEDAPMHDCYLCAYAFKNCGGIDSNICNYCPCLWGSENNQNGFYCQPELEGGGVDWRTSPIDDIINLPIKPELL